MKRLRRLLIVLVVLGLVLGVGAVVLIESGVIERTIVAQAGRMVDGELRIGDVAFLPSEFALEVRDVSLASAPGLQPELFIPRIVLRPPLRFASASAPMPSHVEVHDPLLRLFERSDGTISPLQLVKRIEPGEIVPSVSIEAGTIELQGTGPLSSILDRVLRPGRARRIGRVSLATFPMQRPALDLLGFDGTLGLPAELSARLSGAVGRLGAVRVELSVQNVQLADPRLADELAPELAALLRSHVTRGAANVDVRFATQFEMGEDATRDGAVMTSGADGAKGAGVPDVPGARSAEPLRSGRTDLNAEIAFSGVEVRLPSVAPPLTDVSGHAAFDGSDLRVFDVRARDGADTIEVEARARDVLNGGPLRVTVRAERLGFDRGLVAGIEEPTLRRAIDDYAPRGSFRFFLESQSATLDGEPRVTFRVQPHGDDASAAFVGHVDSETGRHACFPYRLQGLEGEVFGEGPHLEIRQIRGRHNGGGLATIDGTVDLRPDASTYTILIRAGDVPLDADMRAALEASVPGAGAIVDRFQPEGRADVEVRAWADWGEEHGHVSGRIEAKDGRIRLVDFPYLLEHVHGTVTFLDDAFEIEDVVGEHGAGTIRVNGKVAREGHDFGMDVRVEARGVEADGALKEALAALGERAADAFAMLEPAGPFDLDLDLKKEIGKEGRFRALLRPRGVDLLPRWLPVPVHGVIGRVEFGTWREDDPDDASLRIRVLELHGTQDGASLALRGHFGEGVESRIEVSGREVALDGPLYRAVLEKSRTADDAAGRLARLLRDIAPRGIGSFRYTRVGEQAGRLTFSAREAAFESAHLPGGSVAHLSASGQVDLDTGDAVVSEIDGILGTGAGAGARARVGRVRVEGHDGGGARVTMDRVVVEGLALDRAALAPLGPSFEQFAGVARPEGFVDADLETVALSVPPAGGGIRELALDGTVKLRAARLAAPLAVRDLDGTLRFSGRDEDASMRLEGGLSDLSFTLAGFRLRDLSARLDVRDGGFTISDLAGDVAGGKLPPQANRLSVAGDADSSFDGRVRLDDADVRELLLLRTGSDAAISGRVTLELSFSGRAASASSLKGGGRIDLKDGELWELPIFATLYRVSLGPLLGADRKPTFKDGHIDFELNNGEVVLTDVTLESPVLSLRGKGIAGPTGVDVLVVPRVLSAQIPLVSAIVELLKEQVISYRIYGPWGRPRVTYWNEAVDILTSDAQVTHRLRLPPRNPLDWNRGF